MTKAVAAFVLIAVIVAITVLVCIEHRPSGLAMPLLVSGAPQTDTAKANMLFSPCPLTPQNLPRIIQEEQV